MINPLPMWIGNNRLFKNIDKGSSEEGTKWKNELDPANVYDAEVIASKVATEDDVHIPMLDLDFDAVLIESTTNGHHHLYLHKPMPWETYKKLLEALAEAGIIEQGYARASIARGYSSLRLPWIKKY